MTVESDKERERNITYEIIYQIKHIKHIKISDIWVEEQIERVMDAETQTSEAGGVVTAFMRHAFRLQIMFAASITQTDTEVL